MLAWIIVIVLLLLFLILPVGIDASYLDETFFLKAKAGPFRIGILPKKRKRAPRDAKPEGEKTSGPPEGKQHPKPKPGPADILELAGVVFRFLSRLRRCVSTDVLMLHICSAAEEPYSAVMQYGYLNAGLSALSPLLHSALKIRNEDIRTAVDLEPGKPFVEFRLAATLQIWEIIYIGTCAGFSFLRWFLRIKRAAKGTPQPAEQKG